MSGSVFQLSREAFATGLEEIVSIIDIDTNTSTPLEAVFIPSSYEAAEGQIVNDLRFSIDQAHLDLIQTGNQLTYQNRLYQISNIEERTAISSIEITCIEVIEGA